jgi:hypothetical protein
MLRRLDAGFWVLGTVLDVAAKRRSRFCGTGWRSVKLHLKLYKLYELYELYKLYKLYELYKLSTYLWQTTTNSFEPGERGFPL